MNIAESAADAYGRLSRVKEYSGTEVYTTAYSYDVLNNLTRVRDALGNTTVITYNTLGQKVAMADPDMGRWYYGYDEVGNLITQTDALGQQLVFNYDELNRLTSKWSVVGGQWSALAQYEYDQGPHGIGRRTLSNTYNTTNWSYDARGRVTQESQAIGGMGPFNTSYTYDALDRVTTMTYPDGEVVAQTYNVSGRPKNLSSSWGETFVSATEYNALGQLKRVQYGNGLEARYNYFGLDAYPHQQWDNRFYGRLFQVCVIAQDNPSCPNDEPSNAKLNLSYRYDNVGNVTAIRDRTNDNQVQRFAYDELNRLTRGYTQAQGSGADQGRYDERYTYDVIGNLLSKNEELSGKAATYTYPQPGQPQPHAVTDLSDGSRFEYDANGNMTLRVEVGLTQTATYAQAFDVENRLVVVTATNSVTQTVTRFWYDADGARVAQVTDDGATIYAGDHYEMFLPGLNLEQSRPSLLQLVGGDAAQTGARVEAASGTGRSLLVYMDNVAYTGRGLPHGGIVRQSHREASRWLDAGGNPAGAPFTIADMTETEQFYRPYVSYNAYNQSFLVTAPAYSSTQGAYATWALVSLTGTVSAIQRMGPGAWPADLERMIVSEANPADGTWLLFWGGAVYGELDQGGHAWGSCGLALPVDATGAPLGEPFQVTPWGTTSASQIAPAIAFDSDHQRWPLVWSTNPHNAPRRVYGRLAEWAGGQIITGAMISVATIYHDAFGPAVRYNPATDEFLVAFTVNGIVSGAAHSWELFHQRVMTDGALPSGVEAPLPLVRYGTHNWTDVNSLGVAESGESVLSYISVRDGGGFFSGPYDVCQFRLDSQGGPLDDGLVSDLTLYATDTEFDVSVGISNTVLAVWGDLRAERGAPDVYGRRYGLDDDLLSPRPTKYYYHGGQRVAQRRPEGMYYLHGDHLGSTSLATYGSGPQMGQEVPGSRTGYLPFGGVRYGGDGLPTDFTFTGQKAVPGIGLMFYRARYYHPAMGRFINPDTAVPNPTNPQLFNRYSYAGNNPVLYNDPDGHCGPLCAIGIGVAIGGVILIAGSLVVDYVDSHGWAYEPVYHRQFIEQTAGRHRVVLPPIALGAGLGVQSKPQNWGGDLAQTVLFGYMGETTSVGPAQIRPGEAGNSYDSLTLLNVHEAGIEALASKMALADMQFILASRARGYEPSMTDHMFILAIAQNSLTESRIQDLLEKHYSNGEINWAT